MLPVPPAATALPLALGRVGRPNWPPCAGIAMSSTSEASADGYSDQRRDHSAAPDDTVHVRRTETLCRWVALKAAAREGAASWCHTASNCCFRRSPRRPVIHSDRCPPVQWRRCFEPASVQRSLTVRLPCATD